METRLQLECECSAESLDIERVDDGSYTVFEVSVWYRGFKCPMTLRERLRWCWRILRTGNPWADSIILTDQNALKIASFINEHAKETNKEKGK